MALIPQPSSTPTPHVATGAGAGAGMPIGRRSPHAELRRVALFLSERFSPRKDNRTRSSNSNDWLQLLPASVAARIFIHLSLAETCRLYVVSRAVQRLASLSHAQRRAVAMPRDADAKHLKRVGGMCPNTKQFFVIDGKWGKRVCTFSDRRTLLMLLYLPCSAHLRTLSLAVAALGVFDAPHRVFPRLHTLRIEGDVTAGVATDALIDKWSFVGDMKLKLYFRPDSPTFTRALARDLTCIQSLQELHLEFINARIERTGEALASIGECLPRSVTACSIRVYHDAPPRAEVAEAFRRLRHSMTERFWNMRVEEGTDEKMGWLGVSF